MNIGKLKEMFEARENREERGITRITIGKDGVVRCSPRRYYMTDSNWNTLLATLEVQGINYEHVTDNAIIIIKHEKG